MADFERGCVTVERVSPTCALIFHLLSNPTDIEKFRKNEFKSTNAISTAQKIVPIFGRIWGVLSNQFIHINSLHSEWHPLHKYKDHSDISATTTIGMLGVAIWFLQITTEFTYIN